MLGNPVFMIDPTGKKPEDWSDSNIYLANRFGVFGNGGESYNYMFGDHSPPLYHSYGEVDLHTKSILTYSERGDEIEVRSDFDRTIRDFAKSVIESKTDHVIFEIGVGRRPRKFPKNGDYQNNIKRLKQVIQSSNFPDKNSLLDDIEFFEGKRYYFFQSGQEPQSFPTTFSIQHVGRTYSLIVEELKKHGISQEAGYRFIIDLDLENDTSNLYTSKSPPPKPKA